jgi:hypothetical protein
MKDRAEFNISWVTLGKIALAVLLAFLIARLWPLLELLLLALLIAITLQPIVEWTAARNWPRSLGVFFCGLILLGSVAVLVAILSPTFSMQGGSFIESLPALRQQWLAKLPASGPIRELADQLLSSPAFSDPKPILERFVAFLSVALSGVTQFFIVVIVALLRGGRSTRLQLAERFLRAGAAAEVGDRNARDPFRRRALHGRAIDHVVALRSLCLPCVGYSTSAKCRLSRDHGRDFRCPPAHRLLPLLHSGSRGRVQRFG